MPEPKQGCWLPELEPDVSKDPSSVLASHWTVPDSRRDRDNVGGVSGFCGEIPLQKLADLYQFLDLVELEVGPWMDVGSFQNDPFLLEDQKYDCPWQNLSFISMSSMPFCAGAGT